MTAAPNYILKITLLGTDKPVITRTLSVPSDYTFSDLHHAIQVAFGWMECHLYKFDILGPRGTSLVCIEEEECHSEYHRCRLRRFDEEQRWWSSTALAGVLDSPTYQFNRITYLYDFGDNWEHEIKLIGREKYKPRVTCITGGGHACVEDVGGPQGWYHLKMAYLGMYPEEYRRERREWYITYALNGDDRGLGGMIPYEWDIDEVNQQLSGIFHRPFGESMDENKISLLMKGDIELKRGGQ
ncbi:MAG: hypothetical protein M1816_007628 [Peltula sp. TS41687]|nr:MAG: hypothetical protein M1816_007628 [Peltula sp. TS41687]